MLVRMEEFMNINEIYKCFESEWVLIENYTTDEGKNITGGKVLYHHSDRAEVYKKTMELNPKKFTVIFTGKAPEGVALLI